MEIPLLDLNSGSVIHTKESDINVYNCEGEAEIHETK